MHGRGEDQFSFRKSDCLYLFFSMQRMTRDNKKMSNCAPVNFAMVELLPVPVEPTQIIQVPALSSSSGGTTGGKSTRAENKENQLLVA
jgi:hypothetical protein